MPPIMSSALHGIKVLNIVVVVVVVGVHFRGYLSLETKIPQAPLFPSEKFVCVI
jgi:hypothetical protein